MSFFVTFFAVVAAIIAAIGAYADGALLAIADGEVPADPRVRDVLVRREKAHRAIAFGRIIAQLLAGTLTSIALLNSGWVPAAFLTPVVVLAGIALVGLSEVAARAAGDAAAAEGLSGVFSAVTVAEFVCAPFVAIGTWVEAALHRVLPPPRLDEADREDAVERFREVVAAEADVEESSEVLLHGVFSLGDTQVHEIMVPRVDIVGIERETPWAEVADRVRSARHARLVVYEGTLDEVVGVIYAKDLLPALLGDGEPTGGWQSLVRPSLFIPSSKSVEKQLREFRSSRRHLAIVVDEFGGTAGLITLEDVLELIIGDIQDEGDVERPEVERGEGGRLWVAAHVTLDALSDVTGAEFRRGDVTTVGGLVMELLGRVPRAGEVVSVAGYRIVVERVARRRVERVYLEPMVAVPVVGGAE